MSISIFNKIDIHILNDILNTIDSKAKIEDYLLSFSPFERYPYVQDQLPTVEYINQLLATPFKIEEYTTSKKSGESGNLYKNLNSNTLVIKLFI